MTRIALAVVVAGLMAPPVHADSAHDRAETLGERAYKQARLGKVEAALLLYRQAHGESPDPKYLANIAMALDQLGRRTQAAEAWTRFLAEVGNQHPRHVTFAYERLAKLGAQLAVIELEVLGDGPVAVDGKRVGDAPVSRSLWIEPGEHLVSYAGGERRFAISAGQVQQIHAVAAPAPSAPIERTPLSRRPELWLGATSLTLAVAATGLALAARSDARAFDAIVDRSEEHSFADARRLESRSTARAALAGIAAVGAVATGAIAGWLLWRRAERVERPSLAITGEPGRVSLHLAGAF